jgi:hypothetical protein
MIVITDHIRWARTIARGVRRSFRFLRGSQEEQDLESTAYLTLVQLACKFDPRRVPPGGNMRSAFRGWATIGIRNQCQREARRLRNGGTYNTRREIAGVSLVVAHLPEKFDRIDPGSVELDEDV